MVSVGLFTPRGLGKFLCSGYPSFPAGRGGTETDFTAFGSRKAAMRPRTHKRYARDGEFRFYAPAHSFAIVLLCFSTVMAIVAGNGEAVTGPGIAFDHHVSDRFDPLAANRRRGLHRRPCVPAL